MNSTKTYDIIGRRNINKELLDQLGREMEAQKAAKLAPKVIGYCATAPGVIGTAYDDGTFRVPA